MDSESFQTFLKQIHNITEEKVKEWWNVISNMMGSNCDSAIEWNTIFIKQISDLYDDMIEEAVLKRDQMLTKIEQLLEKSSDLCKELNLKLPDYGSDCLTLFEEQEYLIARIKEYEEKIEIIQKEIKKLNKEEIILTKSLGLESKPLLLHPLPVNDIVHTFKTRIDELESLKFEREEEFLRIKSQIIDVVEELNYKPSLDFERVIISPDDQLFMVSDANMENLHHFANSIQQLYNETKEEILTLREKLKSLWDLLNEDLKMRDAFLQNHTGNNRDTLKALQEEVKRCENLKKANIEKFVKRLRTELVALWDKCHFNEDERSNFEYFYSDTYSEDLLSIHDLEIVKMQSFYNSNSDLFVLLEKRSELWARMLELEEYATMPDRFKNRGGQLLKEEKERNGLAKRLPKIEQQLLHLTETFQIKYGKPFSSWGKTVDQIISEAHQAYDENKKNKLSERKHKRDQTPSKVTLGMTYSGSTQNLMLVTPKSGIKRKLLTPYAASSSKQKVLAERHENVARTAPSKIMVNRQLQGPSRLSIERGKRLEKCRRIARRKLQKQIEKENQLTEYDVFEKDLVNKEDCRSTLFEGNTDANSSLATPLPVTPNRKCITTPQLCVAPSLETQF